VDLEVNRGKGGAMNAVLSLLDADITVFIDADLGSSAAEAYKIIDPVLNDRCDLCIAAFPLPAKKGGFGMVKGTAARAIRRVGNIEVTAPLSGQRAMTREVLQAVTPFEEAYGVELGMSIKALQRGFRLLEVPTTMSHNETGRDLRGFLHRGKQFMDVLRVIRKETRGSVK
jgi:glycosyltransferase involved in cell wall biosynthesis